MRPEEAEELWGDFRDVVATLYQDPAVVSKMETKLKRGFLEDATRSCAALKAWLNKFVKAGRERFKTEIADGHTLQMHAEGLDPHVHDHSRGLDERERRRNVGRTTLQWTKEELDRFHDGLTEEELT